MEQMKTVVNRLSEIEGAAIQLEEMAVEQKKEIDAEYQRKLQEFDREIDAQTKEKLKQLNQELEKQSQEELLKMNQETEWEMAAIKAEYNLNHRKFASELVKKIIGE